MKHFWQLLSRLGIHCCVVYRRPLYPLSDQTGFQAKAASPPPGVRVALGEPKQLLDLSSDSEYRLNQTFVRQALADGHQAVLTYLDDRIVAYGWVSYTSTPHTQGWWVEFAPGHRYNYNNYTLPASRGRHLRGSYGVLTAPDKEHSASHSIAFMSLHNRSSIRAEQRNGGTRTGYAGYLQIASIRWSFSSPGARAVGFRFTWRGHDE